MKVCKKSKFVGALFALVLCVALLGAFSLTPTKSDAQEVRANSTSAVSLDPSVFTQVRLPMKYSGFRLTATQENLYKIKYDLNGGTGTTPATQTVKYSEKVTLASSAGISKTGYTFVGWRIGYITYGEGTVLSKLSEGDALGTTEITAKAIWKEHSYKIKYDLNGGTGTTPATQTVKYTANATLASGAGISKAGCTFGGWSYNDKTYEAGAVVNKLSAGNTAGTTEITLKAVWLGAKYVVTYDANGGSVSPSYQEYTEGVGLSSLPTPTRTGYTFDGWYSGDKKYTNVPAELSGNLALTANWTENSYQVKYDLNGGTGTAPATQTVNYTARVTLASSTGFSKAGYTFVGWRIGSITYGESTVLSKLSTGNATGSTEVAAKAIWKENSYKIKYDLNGGTGTTPSTQTVKYTANVTLPSSLGITRTGYTFAGWSYNNKTYAAGAVTNKLATGNASGTTEITMKAVWNANTYTVTYNANGGSVSPTTQTYKTDTGLSTLPTPTRAGYTFKGWYSEGTKYTKIIAGTTVNLTLAALWSENTYTVTYNANGGSVSPTSQTYKTSTGLETLPTPTRAGYTFDGWYEDNIKYTRVAAGATYDLNLTAHWTENSYKVKYDLDGGTGTTPATQTVKYTERVTLASSTGFSKAGYTFVGWRLNGITYEAGASLSKLSTGNSAGTTELMAVAIWKENSYKVKYDLNGGTGTTPATQTVKYSANVTLALGAGISKAGYTFAGWSYNNKTYVAGAVATKLSTGNANGTTEITMKAVWNANTYTVTYNANGGSVSPATQTFKTDTGLSTLPTPTRAGYTFTGWYNGGTKYTKINAGTVGNLTLTASWSENTYTVTYNANGGSVSPTSQTYKTTTGLSTLPTPTRTGYTFDGWYEGNIKYTRVAAGATYNLNLTAHWIENSYKIKYDLNGGTGTTPSAQTVKYTANVTLASSLGITRNGYTFAGWYFNGKTYAAGAVTNKLYTGNATGTTEITLKAVWNANTYTVTYNANGGSVSPATQTFKTDTGLSTLPTPTRAGYTFTGWYNGGTKYTKINAGTVGNLTLTASWTANTYTVTYDPRGGSVSPTSQTYKTGTGLATLPTPTRPGYTFDGWYLGYFKYPKIYASEARDMTLEAHWTPNTYTIKYNAKGGTVTPETQTYKTGTGLSSLPTPTREGYTFDGWYLGYTKYTYIRASEMRDFEFEAHWTPKTYTVRYNAKGGTVTPETQTYKTGTGLSSLPTPTREGFIFDGWYLGYTKYTYIRASEARDFEFEAHWTAKTYTINYNPKGGTVSPSTQTYKAGTGLSKLPTPVRDGYKFDGWYLGYTKYTYIRASEARDFEFDAHWTKAENAYKIKYDLAGATGTTPATQTVKYSESVKLAGLTGFSKPGFYFCGWMYGSKTYPANATVTQLATGDPDCKTEITMRALWAQNTYRVKYDLNGGTGTTPSMQYVLYACNLTLPSSVGITKTGYTFAGWSYNGKTYPAGSTVTKLTTASTVITMSAVWNVNTHTVTYNANGGSVSPASQTFTEVSGLSSLPTPTRSGYTFDGWYNGSTKYTQVKAGTTSNLTLTAKWVWNGENSYKIKYDLAGGTGTVPATQTVKYSQNVKLAGLTGFSRPGYYFRGWSYGSKTYPANDTVSKLTTGDPEGKTEITVRALWAMNTYRVSFDLNGGTGTTPSTLYVTYSCYLPFPAASGFSRAGYTFVGWLFDGKTYPAGTKTTMLATSSTAITVKAVWSANTYTVNYNANGGSMSSTKQTFKTDTGLSTLPTPTKPGYTFTGWYSGNTKYTKIDAGTIGNLSLTAKWTENSYRVKYDLSGGTGTVPAIKTYKYTDVFYLPTKSGLSYPGNSFYAWSCGNMLYAAGTDVTKLSTGDVNGNTVVTVKAIWF